MEDIDSTDTDQLSKIVTQDNRSVLVEVTHFGSKGWQLTIVGEKGYFSNWTEFFPSAQEALQEGLSAIEKEGIDEFISNDEFAYLNDILRDKP